MTVPRPRSLSSAPGTAGGRWWSTARRQWPTRRRSSRRRPVRARPGTSWAWPMSTASGWSSSTRTGSAPSGNSRARPRNPEHVRRQQIGQAQERCGERRPGRSDGGAAIVASHRIGATAGSARRFAGTASGVKRPKCHHAIGAVTTVQAIETAAASPTVPRRRGTTRRIAATAANDSWNPGIEELERVQAEHDDGAARHQVPRRRRARREPCRRDQDSRNAGPHYRRARAGHEHVRPGHPTRPPDGPACRSPRRRRERRA